MEKHKCKLCFRSFSNGRALGGHMRSHMLNLPVPPKQEAEERPPPPPPPPPQPQLQPQPPPPPLPELSDSAESASSASSSSSEEEEETEERELDDEKGLYYVLRENPKRSIRLVDPEFSFAVDAGSVILQDRESETESSKNPTRRRSKRTRKSGMFEHNHNHNHNHHHHQFQQQYQKIDHHRHHNNNQEETDSFKKVKLSKLSKTESWAEPEPVSSVSDATTEEDVAFCLMMLSRDKWKRQENRQRVEKEGEEQKEDQEEEEERSMEESDESEELKSSRTNVRTRGKYKCETCKKVFRSYQALGGHRASHKKVKASNNVHNLDEPESMEQENAGGTTSSTLMVEKKIHECPVCFRVFSSGQALGGHKRSHVTGSSPIITTTITTTTTTLANKNSNKVVESLIDLNLPAPVDEDEISQIELSAVSDAEFVNPITR